MVDRGAAVAAPVTFSDGTFADAEWIAAKIVDTTAGAAASFSAAQSASEGNPGSFRSVTHTYGPGSVWVSHHTQAGLYDPAVSGAIGSVDFAYDLIHLNPPPSQAVAYSILLLQDGNYYRTEFDLTFDAAWTHFAHVGLVASSFTLAAGSGPSTPDFSATGLPIRVGFISANSNSGGAGSISRTSGIDNWTVTFHPIPEPALGALLGLGALAVGARRAAAAQRGAAPK